MIGSPPFELLDGLLGRRTDDPGLIELHRDYPLKPLPAFTDRGDISPTGSAAHGFELTYQATARVPGCYPSIRVRGRGALLGYLTKVWIREDYPLPMGDGLSTALPEPEARARALHSSVQEYGNIVHVLRRDERSTLEARYHDDGRFIWFLLTLNERDEDDPELLKSADAVLAAAPAREYPSWPEPGADEPFPAALRALHDHQAAHGFGEIDFEMRDHFAFGGPHAWTGNPAAEREFRVFGHDGSGGLAAFWLVHEGRPVEEQPVVFLESEGAMGPVAPNLCDLLHLLAGGIGPYEAITFGASYWDADPQPEIARIAEDHFGPRRARTPQEIIDDADGEYSDLMDRVDALSTH
ncbi:hypothetical protein [Actinomadura verrucosospora]|uniref:Uncharacterized protein n=1 Tax=Actinomadura verrucosospora TaxID=46165 RepID=A0A7D3VVI9_ACTVE|nr:hypothetical protein [Actinomadura verrucosospora]QKG19971.1 hypothetical protein ACTIVE_1607 [Actinomadura verrucosospora]